MQSSCAGVYILLTLLCFLATTTGVKENSATEVTIKWIERNIQCLQCYHYVHIKVWCCSCTHVLMCSCAHVLMYPCIGAFPSSHWSMPAIHSWNISLAPLQGYDNVSFLSKRSPSVVSVGMQLLTCVLGNVFALMKECTPPPPSPFSKPHYKL